MSTGSRWMSEHLLREWAPQVLGAMMRRFGNFADAEDAVQEALLAAARQWPAEGVPREPLHRYPKMTDTVCSKQQRWS